MLKKLLILTISILLALYVIIEITNRNTMMTTRQKVLKSIYPVFTFFNRVSGQNVKVIKAPVNSLPPQSIYDLTLTFASGETKSLGEYRGRKLLLVNTASDCGYTPQYEDLQSLKEIMGDKLEIIGFPANDFKEQEKGSDEEIAAFCKKNYGVSFPIAKKSSVVKGSSQNEIFRWLSDTKKNGWNNKSPSWNFSKYLIGEDGKLLYYFDPSINPMGEEILNALGEK